MKGVPPTVQNYGTPLTMPLTRRNFVRFSLGSMLSASAGKLLAQGVSPHTTKPMMRPAASGRPFNAHFVDVAHPAGLRDTVIYGGMETKKYILESTGCGCAFLDYDNDGWMDIFLLSGTRLTGDPPEATNRLYKNNRDGTFSDVTEKAGLKAVGWASAVCIGDYNNDGFEDHLLHVLWPKPSLSQQWRWYLHRCNQGSRTLERSAAMGCRLQFSRL